MSETEGIIAEKLKEIINRNGPDYMSKEPFSVYEELIQFEAANKKLAGAILYVLLIDAHKYVKSYSDITEASKVIQGQCSFKKSLADSIALTFSLLYSPENASEWKSLSGKGLNQFLNDEFEYTWEGFVAWDGGECTLDCHYEAEIVLNPLSCVKDSKILSEFIANNPYATKEDIIQLFEKDLDKYLDAEFEKYCTEDDYYEPVAEDFDIEYCVEEWSKKNGFEIVYCDGDGDVGEYEPKFRRRWF